MAQASTVKAYFDTLPQRFVAESARHMDAVYQFEISGEGGGAWQAILEDGALKVREGRAGKPTVTFKVSGPDWLGLVNGAQDATRLYFDGKLKVEGDQLLWVKYPQIFPHEKR
jgi:putative sterol carrier protein